MTGGAVSGRWTCCGCGVNVTATARAPTARASATMRVRTPTWPRWTPSKLPIVTTEGPNPSGTSERSVQRCTQAPVETATGPVGATCGHRGPGHSLPPGPPAAETWSGGREDEHGSHGTAAGLDQRDQVT